MKLRHADLAAGLRAGSPLLCLSTSSRGYDCDGLLLLFWSEDQILISGIWHYLLYSMYNHVRGAREQRGAADVASSSRAQVRSLSTRSHKVALAFGAM